MNRWMTSLAALAMTLVMWGCDSSETMQPELAPTPVVVTSKGGQRYVVASERKGKPAQSISAQIGPDGGVLTLDRHSVYVTPGAVTAATKFTITKDAEDALRVKLTAGRESENDVGAAGFNAPVYLVLNYQKVEDLPKDKTTLTIVYFRPDGLVDELDTDVRVWGTYAVAQLPHFSLFGLAWPW